MRLYRSPVLEGQLARARVLPIGRSTGRVHPPAGLLPQARQWARVDPASRGPIERASCPGGHPPVARSYHRSRFLSGFAGRSGERVAPASAGRERPRRTPRRGLTSGPVVGPEDARPDPANPSEGMVRQRLVEDGRGRERVKQSIPSESGRARRSCRARQRFQLPLSFLEMSPVPAPLGHEEVHLVGTSASPLSFTDPPPGLYRTGASLAELPGSCYNYRAKEM